MKEPTPYLPPPRNLSPPKYRIVFEHVKEQYRIQQRFFYFWYILLDEIYEKHELYQAKAHLAVLRQDEQTKKYKKKYTILDY